MSSEDALCDILDICVGWTRKMTDKERLTAIQRIAQAEWLRVKNGQAKEQDGSRDSEAP